MKLRGLGAAFRRYLLTLFLVVLGMALLLVPIYGIALKSAYQHSIEVLQRNMEIAATQLDACTLSLMQIEPSLDTLEYGEVRRASDEDFTSVLLYKLIECQELLATVTQNISGPSAFFLVFHNNSYIISAGDTASIYPSGIEFFSRYVRYESTAAESLYATLRAQSNQLMLLPSSPISVNFAPTQEYFTISLRPLGSSITLCALYSLAEIRALFQMDQLPADAFLHYTAKDGGTIFRLGAKEESPRDTCLTQSLHVLGGSITLGIPLHYFTQQIAGVWRMIVLYILFACILGALLSVLLALYNYRPLYQLMKITGNAAGGALSNKNEFTYLTELNHRAENMRLEWQNQIAAMRQAIRDSHLERLLTDEKFARQRSKAINQFLPELQHPYRAVILDIGYNRSENEAENIILLTLPLFERIGLRLSYIGYGQLFTLLPEKQLPAFKSMLSELNDILHQHCDAHSCTVLSSAFTGAENLRRAFQEVQLAAAISMRAWAYAPELPFAGQPVKMASVETICSHIRAGNGYAVERDISGVLNALLQNDCNYASVVRLFDTLRNALIALTNELAEPMEIQGFVANMPLLEQFNGLSRAALELCEKSTAKKEVAPSRNERLMEFIREKYTLPDMYAGYVAEAFGISTKQVYRIVREMTGNGFSDHLESLRIQHALKLLSESNLAINDISAQCGFNSVNTFYKSFKRVCGTSPTNYRAQISPVTPPKSDNP